MKLLGVFRKTLREQTRDRWTLLLMLITSPFFVFLYWVFFGGGSMTYDVLVLNQDRGVKLDQDATWNAGEEITTTLENAVVYKTGQSILNIKPVTDRSKAEERLKDRSAELLLILPENLSQTLADPASGTTTITVVGDLTNAYYAVASVLATAGLDGYLQSQQSMPPRPVLIEEESLSGSGARTEFETYVPGLLIFAVMMLVFPVSMAIAYEIESGTLRRLQLTRLSAFDLLGGTSAALVLIGVSAVIATILTGLALGFHSQGPLWVAVLISAVTSLSVIGVGLIVACFSRTVTQAFLVANFPLMLMMFFSGAIFPIPQIDLLEIGSRSIGLYDILPPTHAVVALNKIMTLGASLADVTYELLALLTLSVVYFGIGIWLFQRTHLRHS